MSPARLILAALFLSFVVAIPAAEAQVFRRGAVRSYPAGTDPAGIAVADLNGDGNLDYVASARGIDSVSVRFGDGAGSFGPRMNYATGDFPTAVALGDLNADGRLDLVVVNDASGTVTVYRGASPPGAFSLRVDYAVGVNPSGVALGDANGDGRVDAVVSNFASNSVTVLVGIGAGTGLSGASFTVPTGTGPRAVALGDLDRDGINDLVTANATADSISVRYGTNAGGFGPRIDRASNGDPFGVALGDLENDGWLDIVTVGEAGSFAGVIMNGAGLLQDANYLDCGDNPSAVAIADMNGDAVADLVVVHDASAFVTVVPGVGNGTFGFRLHVGMPGANALALAVADVDRDGRRDILIPTFTTSAVSVLLGNGAGPFGPIDNKFSGTTPTDIAADDLDGDGHRDLVAANPGSHDLTVFRNLGDGAFDNAIHYPGPPVPTVVQIGKLNADALPDLVVGSYANFVDDTSRVSVMLNAGGGVFTSRIDYDMAVQSRWRQDLALGDVTGDGNLDVAVAHGNTTEVRILPGTGTGTLTAGFPLTVASSPYPVRLIDVNANGTLDLLAAGQGINNLSVLLGDGVGGFAPKVDHPLAPLPTSIDAADFDGDGKLDLVVCTTGGGSVTVLKGNGNGTFASGVEYLTPGGQPQFAVAGDVNQDALVDLVVGIGGPFCMLFYGAGDGTFGLPNLLACGDTPVSLVLTNLDGNAVPDLATANREAGTISVLLGRQKTRTTLTVSPNPSPIGSMVTWTAQVVEAMPDSSAPAGNVRFFDSLTMVGTAPLVNGVATLSQAASHPWDRTLTAEYVGNARFFGSISPAIPHLNYPQNVAVEPPGSRAIALAVSLARNPVVDGAVRVRVALASSTEPAELALVDVRGRVVARVAAAAGEQSLSVGRELSPGVYHVRLVQGAHVAVARAVVL